MNPVLCAVAAFWRVQHGNAFKAYKIKNCRAKGFSKSEIAAEIIRQSEINNAREEPNTLTVREWCDQGIIRRLATIAANIPDDGYSMGSWYHVDLMKPGEVVKAKLLGVNGQDSCYFRGSSDRTREYPPSYKFKAKHGSNYLEILPRDLFHIEERNGRIFNRRTGETLHGYEKKQRYYLTWEKQ